MGYFDIPMVDRVYLEEIVYQCNYGIESLRELYKVYSSKPVDNDKFWYHIQMFLTSTANVDKLLFGAKSKYVDHHKEIRDRYNFPEVEFSLERKIRNTFDHIDEHLVDWSKNSKSHNIASNNIMPKNQIQGDFDFFRNFDPTTNILSFGNLEIDTEKTFNKLVILNQRIQEMLELP